MTGQGEVTVAFDCFGSTCGVAVSGRGRWGSPEEATELVRRMLLSWHRQFSRFLPDSELSQLNASLLERVPVSPLMARLARAVISAGALSGGLVDGTLLDQIEGAGYARDLRASVPLEVALKLAPPRRAARPSRAQGWRQIEVDRGGRTVTRSPGIRLDSGGIAKGLFADALAGELSDHGSFAINCAGDLMIGGAAGVLREVEVESPFDGRVLEVFHLPRGGVATSGIGRRSWLDRDGRAAHHLLDPSTGRPAFTGIVQVTALAPTALLAEVYAKAAILIGPRGARSWMPYGGVVVFEDGSHEVVDPPAVVTLNELAGRVPEPRLPEPQAA